MVVIIASEWINLSAVCFVILCSHFSSSLLWTVYFSSAGLRHWNCTTAMGLHSCKLRCLFKRTRWYSEVRVCECVCLCACVCMYGHTFDGYRLCLRSILIREDGHSVILKSYLCIFFFSFVRLYTLTRVFRTT